MFQLHDRVRLAETSGYYIEGSQHNPSDQIGVIRKIDPDDELPLTVLWEEGAVNSYSATDLLHAEKKNATATDAVNHPTHYEIFRGIEAQDLLKVVADSELVDRLTTWETHCFLTMLKYRLRAGEKGNVEEDLGKAQRYKECLVRTEPEKK